MLKLIIKSLILISLIILISELLNKRSFLPYHWGNNDLDTKISFLKEQNIDPRAYFIGSSVTFRQTIPSLFDKIINNPTNYSFNIAIDGAMPPQTFYILDNLLEQDSTIDYVFFEVNSFDNLGPKIFQSTRSKYYFNIGYLILCTKYLYYSTLRLIYKGGMAAKYVVTFIENTLKIGMREDFLKYIKDTNIHQMRIVGENKDGFRAFPNDKTRNKEMLERLPTYIKNTKNLFTTTYASLNDSKNTSYNKELRNCFLKQLKKADKKGVKLIFILNPVAFAFDEIPEMVALFYSLPATNRLDLADPFKHSEFYQLENRWDEGHLNEKGALLYSQKLSKLFKTLPN